MIHLTPLLADLGDILTALIPCVVFVIWLIGQIAGKQKQAGPAPRPARPAQPAQPRPAQPRPAGQPAAGLPGEEALMDEIEQFVKRAGGQGRGAGPVEVEILQPQAIERPAAPLRETPVDAMLVQELSDRHNVESHVRQRMDTSRFDRRADRLGDQVEQADDQMDERLAEKFDHKVGTLADTSTGSDRKTAPHGTHDASEENEDHDTPYARTDVATAGSIAQKAAATPTAAVDFAAMLRNVDNVRQAVVLNEILQRPEDHWG